MTRWMTSPSILLMVLFTAAVTVASREAISADELEQSASWQPLPAEAVKERVTQWLNEIDVDDDLRERVEAMWDGPIEADGQELHRRVMESLAAVDASAAALLQSCEQANSLSTLPDTAWLLPNAPEAHADFVSHNCRLYLGKWYAMHQMYDEAFEQLVGMETTDVVDPASLLFYRSVAHFRLRQKELGLQALDQLLENSEVIPRRFSTVAELMKADLQPLEVDSLDEISRIMDSVRVRLGLGRAGSRVREEEDEVINKLDKLIEEAEKQRQEMEARMAAGKGGQGNQSSRPAPDSFLPQMRASGDVDAKKLGAETEWGNLPPKERQEALQLLGKEFPSHYREVVEEYFRKLARNEGSAE